MTCGRLRRWVIGLPVATLLALSAGLAAAVATAPSASAHSSDQSYLFLDVTDQALGGRVELNYGDVREVLGLELDGDSEENQRELDANEPALQRYADDHVDIGTGWELDFVGVDVLDAEGFESEGFAVLPFEAQLPAAEPPRQFEVRFDPFFDEIEGRDALLIVSNDWQSGVIENEADWLVRYTAADRQQQIDLDDTSWTKNLTASIEVGVDHIRTGPDHVFFVFVLLLPSVLIYRAGWRPAPSFWSALWRILKIATMFTLAHSITFSLAGLDLLPLPSPKLIETTIAISIVVAALHNLRPTAYNREWMIAFVFGLFHGMGFASLISNLDASRSTQMVSLLGRNIGIEIGQIIVILLVFPALFILRRTRWYLPILTIASLALAAVAGAWAIERIFETDFGTTDLADRFVKFPRSLGLAVALTAAACGIYWIERRRGRLIPVYETSGKDAAAVDHDRLPTHVP